MSPDVLSGSPVIAGSRVPVRRLWAWHRGGSSIETLMRRYPQLGPSKVLAALAFAYDNEALIEEDLAREQELLARETGERPPGLRPMAQAALPGVDAPPPTRPAKRR
jgi:uncharacterized protein (DUF433 family)